MVVDKVSNLLLNMLSLKEAAPFWPLYFREERGVFKYM